MGDFAYDEDRVSSTFCEHANENPAACTCSKICYCKSHTCRSKDYLIPEKEKMNLFQLGTFSFHSGGYGLYKIECDALTDHDLNTLAQIVASRIKFSQAIGVPTGGIRFANALSKYASATGLWLIVDDVLTTGASMEEAKDKLFASMEDEPEVVGVVIFARNKCPSWVKPIFEMKEWQ